MSEKRRGQAQQSLDDPASCSRCGAPVEQKGWGITYCRSCRSVHKPPNLSGIIVAPKMTSDPDVEPFVLLYIHAHFFMDNSQVGRNTSPVPPRSGCRIDPAASRNKGGRPRHTDYDEDRRVADAWKTGNYKSHADLATAMRMTRRKVKLALDRQRKRAKLPGKTSD